MQLKIVVPACLGRRGEAEARREGVDIDETQGQAWTAPRVASHLHSSGSRAVGHALRGGGHGDLWLMQQTEHRASRLSPDHVRDRHGLRAKEGERPGIWVSETKAIEAGVSKSHDGRGGHTGRPDGNRGGKFSLSTNTT